MIRMRFLGVRKWVLGILASGLVSSAAVISCAKTVDDLQTNQVIGISSIDTRNEVISNVIFKKRNNPKEEIQTNYLNKIKINGSFGTWEEDLKRMLGWPLNDGNPPNEAVWLLLN